MARLPTALGREADLQGARGSALIFCRRLLRRPAIVSHGHKNRRPWKAETCAHGPTSSDCSGAVDCQRLAGAFLGKDWARRTTVPSTRWIKECAGRPGVLPSLGTPNLTSLDVVSLASPQAASQESNPNFPLRHHNPCVSAAFLRCGSHVSGSFSRIRPSQNHSDSLIRTLFPCGQRRAAYIGSRMQTDALPVSSPCLWAP